MTSFTFLKLGLRLDQMGRARAISRGATALMSVLGLFIGANAGTKQALLGSSPATLLGVLAGLSLATHFQGRMRVASPPEEQDFLRSLHVAPRLIAWLKLMQQTGAGSWLTLAGPAALVSWGVQTPGTLWPLGLLLWPALHLTTGQLVQALYVWVDDAAARRWYHRLLTLSLAIMGVLGAFAIYGAMLAPQITRQIGGSLFGSLSTYVNQGLTPGSVGHVAAGLALTLLALAVVFGLGSLVAHVGYRRMLAVESAELHLTSRTMAPPRHLLRERSPLATHLGKNLLLLRRVGGPLATGLLITTSLLLGLLWFTTRGLKGDAASPTGLRIWSSMLLGFFAYMLSNATGPTLMRQDTGWLGVVRASGQLRVYLLAQWIAGTLLALPAIALLGVLTGLVLQLPLLPLVVWGAEAVGLMIPIAIYAQTWTLKLGGDPSQPNTLTMLPTLLAIYPALGLAALGATFGWWALTLVIGPLAVTAGAAALVHGRTLLAESDLP